MWRLPLRRDLLLLPSLPLSCGAVPGAAAAAQEQLLAWLLVENEKLAARPDAAWLAEAAAGRKAGAGPAYEKALAKARAFGFFLGLDDSWLAS